MNRIPVISIQRGCVYDGPGVRTTVFLKGCTLHCPWCCNPESINLSKEFFYYEDRCLKVQGIDSAFCLNCQKNDGIISISECPLNVMVPVSKDWTTDELLKEILKDECLFKESNGGVTFSGGEPLLWIEKISLALRKLRDKSIDIVFETSLQVPFCNVEMMAEYANRVILDLKLQEEMLLHDCRYTSSIQDKITLLQKHQLPIDFRLVFVNSVYDQSHFVIDKLKQLGVKQLELLKCHNLAQQKYKCLGLPFNVSHVDEEKYNEFTENLIQNQILTFKMTV